MKKFEKLLEQLEDTLLGSATIPFTALSLVNGDRLLNLLDTLRDTLPEEMALAREVIHQQEAILADARNQAVAMLHEAKQQQQHLLANHTLMQAIQDEAQRIRLQLMENLELEKQEAQQQVNQLIQEAQQHAQQLRAEAQQYASYVLQGMESRLQEIQERVRHSQEHLNDLHVEAVTIQAQAAMVTTPPTPLTQTLTQPTSSSANALMPPLMQQVQQVGNQGKRQPRAKVASMQAPLLSEGSPEEQVKEALALLYGEKSTASSNTQQRSSTHTRRRYRRP